MSGPMIAIFGTQLEAYAHDAAMKSYAVEHGLAYETQVQPWKGGWRVVVFDHTPQVVDVAQGVTS